MLDILLYSFRHALVITIFVFMMMVIVEYINILLKGRLPARTGEYPTGQSIFAGILGAAPGCLGVYANVALYEHGALTFGALVAGMIATTGDEAFVMLSLFPGTFLIMSGVLLAMGVATALILNAVLPTRLSIHEVVPCDELVVHEHVDEHPSRRILGSLVANLGGPNLARWAILVFVLTYAVLIATGFVGYEEGLWWKIMLLAASAVCIWVTLFGSRHFITEHVWQHVIMRHVPHIFLWTLGALFVCTFITQYIDVAHFVEKNRFLMLAIACAVGIIPLSGPHLVFVTLFASGALPFSILLANSIVQDGHGMLPLLAFSRRGFVVIKLMKFVLGMAIGAAMLAMGW